LIENLKEERKKPFDWIGFALSSTACVTFMYGLELIGREVTAWRPTVFYLLLGCILATLSVFHFRRATFPLLNLDLLKIKTFAITIMGGSLFRISISMSPFLLPLMFQVGFGLNAFQAGLLMLGLFAGNLGMKSVTTQVLRRFGFRSVLIVNGLLTAIMMMACAAIFPQTPRLLIIAILFANGLCRSMQFTSLSTLAFADVPKPDFSSATSFFSMMTQMTMGMGVAVGAIALRLAALLTGNTSGTPSTREFHIAFVFVAILTSLAVIDCFALKPDAGAVVSRHRMNTDPEKI
jgi:hypothetical protein